MPARRLLPLLMVSCLAVSPVAARDVQVEVEVLHLSGLLAPAELEAMLADPRLRIDVLYSPERLIEGVTARRNAFPAAEGCPPTGVAPPAVEVQALASELQRIREAFLRE